MSTLDIQLQEVDDEAWDEVSNKFLDLVIERRFDEAQVLLPKIPMIPEIANDLKTEMGIEAVLEAGVNVSEAVKKYGTQWLEK